MWPDFLSLGAHFPPGNRTLAETPMAVQPSAPPSVTPVAPLPPLSPLRPKSAPGPHFPAGTWGGQSTWTARQGPPLRRLLLESPRSPRGPGSSAAAGPGPQHSPPLATQGPGPRAPPVLDSCLRGAELSPASVLLAHARQVLQKDFHPKHSTSQVLFTSSGPGASCSPHGP